MRHPGGSGSGCALGVDRVGTTPGPTSDKGTVSGLGTVVLKRKPELLRIKVDLIAQGKTMKEALASLKDRREAAQAQLALWGG